MTHPKLDPLQREYKAAVEEWIAAIKHEEALAGPSFRRQTRSLGAGAFR
jgi:hypothetical protein